MTRMDVDVMISGGGVAGLAAAAAFGAAGFSVLVVDPAPPVTVAEAPGSDTRTTALLRPARALLTRAGLWERLLPEAAALSVMRIAEALEDGSLGAVRDFRSGDLSPEPFGWNFPNWLLRRELVARLAELPQVSFLPGEETAGVLTRETAAELRLASGRQVRARLLIAADGRDSPVRRALALPVRTHRYAQSALSFPVTHPLPHEGVSTEIHRQGGPFTFVPLPDRAGVPASAVVWMEREAEAARLMALPPEAFAAEATARSCNLLGPLALAGRRGLWPMMAQVALRLTAERTALVAEAAHVVPPIGAQGLNMSLADITLLLDLAEADRDGLGTPQMLARYERRRLPALVARVAGIDMLNRASMAGSPAWRGLRARAMAALHDVAPLRRGLMRLGMGL